MPHEKYLKLTCLKQPGNECSVAGLVTENVVGMDRNEAWSAMFIIPQHYVQFPVSYSQVRILLFVVQIPSFCALLLNWINVLFFYFTTAGFQLFTRFLSNEIFHNENFYLGIGYRATELSCSLCPCF